MPRITHPIEAATDRVLADFLNNVLQRLYFRLARSARHQMAPIESGAGIGSQFAHEVGYNYRTKIIGDLPMQLVRNSIARFTTDTRLRQSYKSHRLGHKSQVGTSKVSFFQGGAVNHTGLRRMVAEHRRACALNAQASALHGTPRRVSLSICAPFPFVRFDRHSLHARFDRRILHVRVDRHILHVRLDRHILHVRLDRHILHVRFDRHCLRVRPLRLPNCFQQQVLQDMS
jgi:hypothetical protein